MRFSIAICFALLVSAAFGQSSKERVDAIWAVATNRMINQQDEWFEIGDFPACINLLKFEAEKWPADYDIWTNLGWMEENVQEWPAALTTYTRFRELNPNEPDRALPEAMYYYQKKQYDQVPALLEPVILHKCHPNNFRVLAWSYERSKKYSEAVRVWKSYIAVAPKDLQAKRNLARDEKRAANPSS